MHMEDNQGKKQCYGTYNPCLLKACVLYDGLLILFVCMKCSLWNKICTQRHNIPAN